MERKIVEYKMFGFFDIDAFNDVVSSYLEDGWELYWNPFHWDDKIINCGYRCQAMVKYESLD